MLPEAWFQRLADEGLTADLDAEVQELLLDLARIAAHASERWTAPLSTWIAGVALAELPPEQRPERLRTLVTSLDPEQA